MHFYKGRLAMYINIYIYIYPIYIFIHGRIDILDVDIKEKWSEKVNINLRTIWGNGDTKIYKEKAAIVRQIPIYANCVFFSTKTYRWLDAILSISVHLANIRLYKKRWAISSATAFFLSHTGELPLIILIPFRIFLALPSLYKSVLRCR